MGFGVGLTPVMGTYFYLLYLFMNMRYLFMKTIPVHDIIVHEHFLLIFTYIKVGKAYECSFIKPI